MTIEPRPKCSKIFTGDARTDNRSTAGGSCPWCEEPIGTYPHWPMSTPGMCLITYPQAQSAV